MGKNVGVSLPRDLVRLLEDGTTAILGTFSSVGVPNMTPIKHIYYKGRNSLLLTILKDHSGYHNMIWQKKVALSFLGCRNVAYSVLGRAGVVRAPSRVHPVMNVVRVDIIDVKCDRSELFNIVGGVKLNYTSEEAKGLSDMLMDELRSLSETL